MAEFASQDDAFEIINSAISEAVTNVVNHAYSENVHYKKWKIFLAITEENCFIIVSDLGKTIPSTVKTTISGDILSLLNLKSWKETSDNKRIDLASSYQRTQTELSHRGKGFKNMLQVTEAIEGAKLIVYSRKGIWGKCKQGGSFTSLSKKYNKDYRTAIDGTVICWQIPLNSFKKSA